MEKWVGGLCLVQAASAGTPAQPPDGHHSSRPPSSRAAGRCSRILLGPSELLPLSWCVVSFLGWSFLDRVSINPGLKSRFSKVHHLSFSLDSQSKKSRKKRGSGKVTVVGRAQGESESLSHLCPPPPGLGPPSS